MRGEKYTGNRTLVGVLVLLASIVAAPVGTTRGQEPQMVEKNLFSPERKPVESKSPESTGEPAKMPKGTIQLDGVFLHGDVKKAILRVNPSLLKDKRKKTDPFVTVGENEQLGDYRIIKIEPRSISVEMRGATFDVPLYAAGKVAPPPAKQVSAAPGGQGAAPVRPGKTAPPGRAAPIAADELQPNNPPGPAGDSGNPMAMRGNQGAMEPPAEVDEPDEGAEGQ